MNKKKQKKINNFDIMKLMIFMIIVIAGPTAVGKTKLSIELA